MNRLLLTAALTAFSLTAVGDDAPTSRAECVLKWMPGVMNDVVAEAVVDHCRDTLVGSRFNATPRKPGEGGMRDAFECIHRYAASTTSRDAAEAIQDACDDLYPGRVSGW
ncbi:hypothetical protein [Endothiovibrio diazotrophicus]